MRCIRLRSTAAQPFHYSDLLAAQEAAFAHLEETGEGSCLLAEVEPVITLGKRGGESALLHERSWYASQGVTLLSVQRGGEATYHGPGNLIVFLVERVERLVGDSKAVRSLTERLLAATLRTCTETGQGPFEIRDGREVGVWKTGTRKKIASLGIELRNRTLLHGLAINVYPVGPSFLGLTPCAIDHAEPGYLFDGKSDSHHPELMDEVSTSIVSELADEFRFTRTS